MHKLGILNPLRENFNWSIKLKFFLSLLFNLFSTFIILIFIIYTFPLILKFDNAFVGDLMGDASQFFWNAYYFKKSFPDVSRILYTNDILYPEGVSLLVNSNTYIYGIAGLFSKNPYFSFNIIVALSFILSGIASYLLCRKYIDNKFLCAPAGFIFAFSPYKLIRLTGHYNLLLTFTIPLLFICFAKIVTLKDDKINCNFDKKNCLIFFGLYTLIKLRSGFSRTLSMYGIFVCSGSAYNKMEKIKNATNHNWNLIPRCRSFYHKRTEASSS